MLRKSVNISLKQLQDQNAVQNKNIQLLLHLNQMKYAIATQSEKIAQIDPNISTVSEQNKEQIQKLSKLSKILQMLINKTHNQILLLFKNTEVITPTKELQQNQTNQKEIQINCLDRVKELRLYKEDSKKHNECDVINSQDIIEKLRVFGVQKLYNKKDNLTIVLLNTHQTYTNQNEMIEKYLKHQKMKKNIKVRNIIKEYQMRKQTERISDNFPVQINLEYIEPYFTK